MTYKQRANGDRLPWNMRPIGHPIANLIAYRWTARLFLSKALRVASRVIDQRNELKSADTPRGPICT